MPLSDKANREQQHTREIKCIGFKRDDGLWDIEASLLDYKSYDFPNHEKNGIDAGEAIHQMHLRVTMNLDFLIHDIEVEMEVTPYRICKQVEANLKKLIGVQIGSGWLKEVRIRIPRTDGCTHVLDLLNPIAATAYQTMHLAREIRERQSANRLPPPILDQCHSLARHTEVVKTVWPEFHQVTTQDPAQEPPSQ